MKNTENLVIKKRGRKSKKDILEQSKENDNITVLIEEKNDNLNIVKEEIENKILENNVDYNDDNDNDNNLNNTNNLESNIFLSVNDDSKPSAKKRGRKPKGGKIIQQIEPISNQKESKPSVILHLKCSIKDLQTITVLGPNVEGFNFHNNNDYSYEIISNNYINNINNINNNNNYYNNLEEEQKLNQNKFFDYSKSDNNYDYEDDVKQSKENVLYFK